MNFKIILIRSLVLVFLILFFLQLISILPLLLNQVKDKVAQDYCDLNNEERNFTCYLTYGKKITLDLNYDINKITEKCLQLKEYYAQNYCFNGMGLALGESYVNVSQAIDQCSKISSEKVAQELKAACFIGLGRTLKYYVNNNLTKTYQICRMFPIEYLEDCYITSLSGFISDNEQTNISLGLSLCNNLSYEQSLQCYYSLGHIVGTFQQNVSDTITLCNLFPKTFQGICFNGLSNTFRSKTNTSDVVKLCNNVDIQVQDACFNGLGQAIGDIFFSNISSSIHECNLVPGSFKNSCFNGLGHAFGLKFEANIFILVQNCNSVPQEFLDDCYTGLSNTFDRRYGANLNLRRFNCVQFPALYQHLCLR